MKCGDYVLIVASFVTNTKVVLHYLRSVHFGKRILVLIATLNLQFGKVISEEL